MHQMYIVCFVFEFRRLCRLNLHSLNINGSGKSCPVWVWEEHHVSVFSLALCLTMCLYVYLPYMHACMFICKKLGMQRSLHPSIHSFIHLCIFISIYLSIWWTVNNIYMEIRTARWSVFSSTMHILRKDHSLSGITAITIFLSNQSQCCVVYRS